MQFYFIRHGQSENNALWENTGSGKGRSQDPGLTEAGWQQAEILASFLKQAGPGSSEDHTDPQNTTGFGLTHLYTSLMLRAAATGTVVARVLDLPLVGWTDLHEGGGIYLDDDETGEPLGLPGNDRAFFETNFPDLVLPDMLGEDGWWNRPFEPREDRRPRARRVLEELLRLHGGTQDRVAIFSHGGFCYHFMSELLGLPIGESQLAEHAHGLPLGRWFLMNNAAIMRLDFLANEVRLNYLNRVDFLPPELIT